jgi:hypothetical protein
MLKILTIDDAILSDRLDSLLYLVADDPSLVNRMIELAQNSAPAPSPLLGIEYSGKKVQLNVRIPVELRDFLDLASAISGRDKGDIVTELLQQYRAAFPYDVNVSKK